MKPVPLEEFFDLGKAEYAEIYDGIAYIWEALQRIPGFIKERVKPEIRAKEVKGAYILGDVYIGEGTVVEPGAVIKGPTIIGKSCEIRSGAYIRGNVLIGDQAVIGNSCELKTALLHNEATVPHFAYVGDSILGWRSHLGAGVKISNLKVDRTPVVVKIDEVSYETGLRKFGCIMGDEVEIGCNSVINPGTLLGKRTLSVANASLSGYYPPGSFIKLKQEIEVVKRR